MCSDPDSYLVPVADNYWNIANRCVMSYIITHSEIMLQISDICSTNTLIEKGDFPFCTTVKKKKIPTLQKMCSKK